MSELSDRMALYAESKNPEDLAKSDLTGRLLLPARRKELTFDEMVFLLRSVTYDAQRISEYGRSTLNLGDVSQLLEDWFTARSVQPKYRLALCMQYWNPSLRNRSTAKLTENHASEALANELVRAIADSTVRELILDPTRATDLDEGRRADLVRHVAAPLAEELGPVAPVEPGH
jgi:hypothetical protein